MANEVTSWIGALTGSAGLALGVVNAWRSHKVRLKVEIRFRSGVSPTPGPSDLRVRILNLSAFAVSIENAKLVFGSARKRHALAVREIGQSFPREIKSREAVECMLTPLASVTAALEPLDRAIVTTVCGKTFRSSWWSPMRGRKLTVILQDAQHSSAQG